MKKFIPIFLIFFFISTFFNIIGVYAAPKTFKQGIYTWSDTGLPANSSITIKLGESTSRAIVMVIDSDQTMEALLRLNSRVSQQVLPPLTYTSSIIIFTDGNVIFS
ncbi:hypothetical protein AXY43_05420 [Clostridium sp. MF28]|uniref:hypothetical protein n=1 Tax=Clostridium TaxID=1485 RepID=UPI000CF98D23|nr:MULTISPECIES: hypothetical protein [Clostridium]AVK47508.1 hypothetical protein AXY43_05420 [Clostridium sp. MF28]PSM58680.1 hypothetical protein C4L39_05805 [Clostridium diolis]